MTGFCTKVIFKVRICGRFFLLCEVLITKLSELLLHLIVISMFCMFLVFHIYTKRKKSGG